MTFKKKISSSIMPLFHARPHRYYHYSIAFGPGRVSLSLVEREDKLEQHYFRRACPYLSLHFYVQEQVICHKGSMIKSCVEVSQQQEA